MPTKSINIVVDPQTIAYRRLLQPANLPRWKLLESARAALKVATTEPVAAWFINIRLPDMSGFELYELLRDRCRDARFVLVGDDYCVDDEIRARTAGVSYLCKPPQAWWIENRQTCNTVKI